ncbi:MAG: hypothetical protein ACE5JL_05445 [Dehalococcoidia bacterium]
MSVQVVIELRDKRGAQTVLQAIEAYKARLRAGIERTRRRLAQFEQRYGVDTARFLREMTAEDLEGGDLEYVEWAGEAKLLEGLEAELAELEYARCHLSLKPSLNTPALYRMFWTLLQPQAKPTWQAFEKTSVLCCEALSLACFNSVMDRNYISASLWMLACLSQG